MHRRKDTITHHHLTALVGLFAPACASTGPCPQVTPNADVGVALEASWSTDDASTARLDFGVDSPYENTIEVSDSPETVHDGLMLDLPPETEVKWRSVSESDGVEQVCEGTAVTGALATWLPFFQVDVDSGQDDPDVPYFIGAIFDTDSAIMFIVNRDAEFVWYQEGLPNETVVQFEPAADDPGTLLYGSFDAAHEADRGEVRRVDLYGDAVGDAVRLERGHHFFYAHPDGTLAYTAVEIREWYDPEEDETVDVAGDELIEIAPDGTTRTLFSTWDWLDVTKSAYWGFSIYQDAKDWTHANAIDYDEAAGTYLLSLANIATIVEIDRATGDPVRAFTGAEDPTDGAWPTVYAENGFDHQHDPNWTDDGTLLMVSTDLESLSSRVVEYEVDEDEQVLRQIWTWGEDQGDLLWLLGNARRLPSGNTLYGGSVVGFVREITPEGDVAWEFNGPGDMRFGNVTPLETLPNGQL